MVEGFSILNWGNTPLDFYATCKQNFALFSREVSNHFAEHGLTGVPFNRLAGGSGLRNQTPWAPPVKNQALSRQELETYLLVRYDLLGCWMNEEPCFLLLFLRKE